MKTLSVIGLGKLGGPLAACLASRDFSVIGVDSDCGKVRAINEGPFSSPEPGLGELISRHRARLVAVDDIGYAVGHSSATFVVVSTPSEADGRFSLREVLPVCRAIGTALRSKDSYHLVVVASTVFPGAMEEHLLPVLEDASRKRAGQEFGLCYSPEFGALGAVVSGFLNPDLLLIGEVDRRSGDHLELIYAQLCGDGPCVVRTTPASAEIAKCALNTFLAVKISYANMIARICERIPSADAGVVTKALGSDGRIDPAYLKGAISYGGPCLPRDVVAMRALARSLGLDDSLPAAVERLNGERLEDLVGLIRTAAGRSRARKATIGILGLAFKPHTDVTDHSPGLQLAELLAAEGDSVVVHDPLARPPLSVGIRRVEDAEVCVERTDIIVVATPWPEYRGIASALFARRAVIDCWGLLDEAQLSRIADYIRPGLHPAVPATVPAPTRAHGS